MNPLHPDPDEELRRQRRESDRIQRETVSFLQRQLQQHNLVICVGSGSTIFSCPQERYRLSLTGLLKTGLDYYENQLQDGTSDLSNAEILRRARGRLEGATLITQDFLDSARDLKTLLSHRSDSYSHWLKSQFENLYTDYATNKEFLDSLQGLHGAGAKLMTTNYDDLIEKHCHVTHIDPSDAEGIEAFQQGKSNRIFHPHGFYKNASRVVLSGEDYNKVIQDTNVQQTLTTLCKTSTILFVGCGAGLADPNFGSLLSWVAETTDGNLGTKHYVLLAGNEKQPDVARLPIYFLRCPSYGDIPRFLTDVLGDEHRSEGSMSELSSTSERKIIERWLGPDDQTDFLERNLAHIGPESLDDVIATINEPGREPLIWVCGEEGTGKSTLLSCYIQHWLASARLGDFNQARDSVAYYFCCEHETDPNFPLERSVESLSDMLKTWISQLCPPGRMFKSLSRLHKTCSKYHPARAPTLAELKDVLFDILQHLSQPSVPTRGNSVQPGMTRLVIDGIDYVTPMEKSKYTGFIRELISKNYPELYLIVSSQDTPQWQKALRIDNKWAKFPYNREHTQHSIHAYVEDQIDRDPLLEDIATQGDLRTHVGANIARDTRSYRWTSHMLNKLRQLPSFNIAAVDNAMK
ncbi:SIR2-like domain-containing protein [Xylariaceae sp. FL0016]|nr:SIR2-like domain-containing protein [Xylariaceae sp. FL0016]